MQDITNDKTLCMLCKAGKAMCAAKAQKISVLLCPQCSNDFKICEIEVKLYGNELSLLKPETYRNKPASSRIWLNYFFLQLKNPKVH